MRSVFTARVFAIVFALVSIDGMLWAQDYSITIYDQNRGFEKNNINCIERDALGFIWMGTDRGVVRFDGVNFLEYPIPPGQLGDVFRLRLFGDRLYVIFSENGVGCIDLKTYRYHFVASERSSDVLMLPDHSVIVYFTDGRLVRYSGNGKVAEASLGTDALASLHYRWGKFFVVNKSSGLLQLDPETFQVVRKYPIECCSRLVYFQNVKDKVLLSSEAGFYELDSALALRPVLLLDDPEMLRTHSNWISHSSGNDYFILKEREVVKKSGTEYRNFPILEKRLTGIRTIHVYDSNNILVGGNGGLIHLRITPSTFSSVTQDKEISEPDFRVRRKVIPIANNNLVLLGNPGFIHWENGKMEKVAVPEPASTYDGVLLGKSVYATAGGA